MVEEKPSLVVMYIHIILYGAPSGTKIVHAPQRDYLDRVTETRVWANAYSNRVTRTRVLKTRLQIFPSHDTYCPLVLW